MAPGSRRDSPAQSQGTTAFPLSSTASTILPSSVSPGERRANQPTSASDRHPGPASALDAAVESPPADAPGTLFQHGEGGDASADLHVGEKAGDQHDERDGQEMSPREALRNGERFGSWPADHPDPRLGREGGRQGEG